MIKLSIRDLVRNAAAVFSGAYGTVTSRARQIGCSRQTLYQQARHVQQRLEQPSIATTPVQAPEPTPAPPAFDQRRFAVTTFAMGISTRQIEDLFQILLGEDGPDHSTIGRWVADACKNAKPVLQALDAACVPKIQTLAVDEIFFGGDRPWSGSSQRA